MTDKMWLILQICEAADGPLNPEQLSERLIEYCLENEEYGFWGKIFSRFGKSTIIIWTDVVYHPGFLIDALEELVFTGRVLAETNNPQSRNPDYRYSITARGRRSFSVFVRYNARVKRRKQKTSLA